MTFAVLFYSHMRPAGPTAPPAVTAIIGGEVGAGMAEGFAPNDEVGSVDELFPKMVGLMQRSFGGIDLAVSDRAQS